MTQTYASIGAEILAQYPDLPASYSGTVLCSIIDDKRIFIEERTGLTVGSPSFPDRFKPAMKGLAAGAALHKASAAGGDATRLSLGDMEVWKGADSTFNNSAAAEEKEGMEALKRIGTTFRFKRVIGGS